MNVLVTGANGFVGRYVVEEFKDAGYTVLEAVHSKSAKLGLNLESAEDVDRLIRAEL